MSMRITINYKLLVRNETFTSDKRVKMSEGTKQYPTSPNWSFRVWQALNVPIEVSLSFFVQKIHKTFLFISVSFLPLLRDSSLLPPTNGGKEKEVGYWRSANQNSKGWKEMFKRGQEDQHRVS